MNYIPDFFNYYIGAQVLLLESDYSEEFPESERTGTLSGLRVNGHKGYELQIQETELWYPLERMIYRNGVTRPLALRRVEDMTQEEKEELAAMGFIFDGNNILILPNPIWRGIRSGKQLDWLTKKKNFDIFNLIANGYAVDITKLKTELVEYE